MPVDLTINPEIESAVNAVEDQKGNKSNLYIGTDNVAIGTASPGTDNSLTIESPAGVYPITTMRPENPTGGRAHFRGMVAGKEIFVLNTSGDDFVISVNGTGGITLAGASLTFSNLAQLSGPNVVDLVIDTSTGQVGHQ